MKRRRREELRRLANEGSGASPAYRPDIDGLRAVAVASVVAYHNFPRTAHGGFVGVDIFFVISGYLITSILAEEIRTGGIDFLDFYARRIRRIFPALALVLLATLLAGAVLLTPEAYRGLGQQVAAGAASVSNLLLWAQAGYFDEEAGTKPLLHLWSLAIEEQFYLVWPLALALCARTRFSLVAFAVAAALASFAFNLWLVSYDPIADFYLVVARFWELAIGGALALAAPRGSAPAAGRLAEGLSWAGVALIVVSLLSIASDQPFPGWRALGPTLGAALLIAAGPAPLFNRVVLGSRPMVAIGKISYPLYLWHWPIITFARIREGGSVALSVRWALIGLAIALAHFTYVQLEKPVRFGAARRRLTGVVAAAVVVLAAVGLIDARFGGLVFRGAGFMQVVHAGDIGQTEFVSAVDALTHRCEPRFQSPKADGGFGISTCLQTQAQGAPDILLLGDSHAHQLLPGLAEALPNHDLGYFGGALLHILDDPGSLPVIEALAAEPRLKTVMIAERWAERKRRYDDKALFRDELRRTVRRFREAGKAVYLVLDTPSFPFAATFCKYYEPIVYPTRCETPAAASDQVRAEAFADVQAVAAEFPGVQILDPRPYLCNDAVCSMASGDALLFRDENHLNLKGSRYVAARLLADHPGLAD